MMLQSFKFNLSLPCDPSPLLSLLSFVHPSFNSYVLTSVWTPSNHLHLDLPIFHFLSSLAFKIFFGNLKSSILTMWSSHSNLPVWISDIILGSLYKFCGSKLVLICQTPFSYMRPYFPFPSHGDRSSSVSNCPNFAMVCDNWFNEGFMSTVTSMFYETTEPKYLKLETSL